MRKARRPRYFFITMSISFVLLASFSVHFFQFSYSASSTIYPPYASPGAYAYYSGNGGFIAFLSGVSSNVSYFVTNVYSNNNSMRVYVNENISLGTELTVNETMISENVTDSIFAPTTFLAVPPENLTSNKIFFENITCKFVENSVIAVPAGSFNATEFQGTNSNGTIQDFWFDRPTGLAIEMLEPATSSYFQLVTTNIAVPVQPQSQLAAEIPFIIVFAVGWTGAGVLFYVVRRYYIRKSQRENMTKGSTVVESKSS